MKRSPLKRTAMKRKPKQRPPFEVEEHERRKAMKREFHREGVRQGCAMCRAFPVTERERQGYAELIAYVEAHHVLPRRHLARQFPFDVVWDVRNALGLCRFHHGRHEKAFQRVPSSLVPAAAREFAVEHGLEWDMDLEYPPDLGLESEHAPA